MSAPRLTPKLRGAGVAGPVFLLATAALLVISSPAAAKRKDRTPPMFEGLKSATTCIPGPIYAVRTASYHLSWDPATDNITPPQRIVYDVVLLRRPREGRGRQQRLQYRRVPSSGKG